MLAKIGLGIGCFCVFSTAYLLQDGFVHVAVDEMQNGGIHLHLALPAALAPLAAHLIPERHLAHVERQLSGVLPAVQAAAKELDRIPDSVLVEAFQDGEHVRVAKSGSGLDVEVQKPSEHVHVWVPLSAVYDTADALESRLDRD